MSNKRNIRDKTLLEEYHSSSLDKNAFKKFIPEAINAIGDIKDHYDTYSGFIKPALGAAATGIASARNMYLNNQRAKQIAANPLEKPAKPGIVGRTIDAGVRVAQHIADPTRQSYIARGTNQVIAGAKKVGNSVMSRVGNAVSGITAPASNRMAPAMARSMNKSLRNGKMKNSKIDMDFLAEFVNKSYGIDANNAIKKLTKAKSDKGAAAFKPQAQFKRESPGEGSRMPLGRFGMDPIDREGKRRDPSDATGTEHYETEDITPKWKETYTPQGSMAAGREIAGRNAANAAAREANTHLNNNRNEERVSSAARRAEGNPMAPAPSASDQTAAPAASAKKEDAEASHDAPSASPAKPRKKLISIAF